MRHETRSALRLAVTPIRRVTMRDASGTGDGAWTIEGYFAVFEQETVLFDLAGWWRVREEIARDAFTRAVVNERSVIDRVRSGEELVHLNHGHDMKTAVASSKVRGIGSLELDADFHGLRGFARVDPEDPDAKALAVKMGRGVIDQGSFAFTIADEERVEVNELEDGTIDELWRITEIGHLYDVCVCAQGAYPQTETYLRSLAAASLRVPDLGALGRAGSDPAGHGGRALPEELLRRAGLAPIAADEPGAGASREREQEHAALRSSSGTRTRQLINQEGLD